MIEKRTAVGAILEASVEDRDVDISTRLSQNQLPALPLEPVAEALNQFPHRKCEVRMLPHEAVVRTGEDKSMRSS